MATFISISHQDLQAEELDPDEQQKLPSKKAFEKHADLMDGYNYHPYFWYAGKLNIMRLQDYGNRYIATNLVKLSYWFCSTYLISGGSYNDMFSCTGKQILMVFMQQLLFTIAYSEGVCSETADSSTTSEGVINDVEPSMNQLEELLEAVRSPVDDKTKELNDHPDPTLYMRAKPLPNNPSSSWHAIHPLNLPTHVASHLLLFAN